MAATLPTADEIRERRLALEATLRGAAETGGHDPARLRVVAITKTWPVEVVRGALEAGLELLGESRVQEAEPKVAAVPDAEWHLVGRLQSNKARRAVRAFSAIHSVDSLELLRRVDAVAAEEGAAPRLLLQVDLGGGAAGLRPEELLGAEALAAFDEVRSASVVGLMTIAPVGATHDLARATFAQLRQLRDRLEQAAGIGLRELSMGMSADAVAAAAEGSTLVRIGTALFGPRS